VVVVNLVNLVNLHLESSSHIPCRIVQAADRVSGQGGGPEDGAGEARCNVEFGITHYDTSWHMKKNETVMKQSWDYKTIKAKEHVGHTFFSFKARFDQWPMFPGTCIHAVHAQFPDLHDLGLNQRMADTSGADSCAHGEGLSDGSAESTHRCWSLRWTYSCPILKSSQAKVQAVRFIAG
jgi:hypothetical protein